MLYAARGAADVDAAAGAARALISNMAPGLLSLTRRSKL
jgi:hypothetical protein